MNIIESQHLIERLWIEAARATGEDPIETRHRFAALVAEECAKWIEADDMSCSAGCDYHFSRLIRAKFSMPKAAP